MTGVAPVAEEAVPGADQAANADQAVLQARDVVRVFSGEGGERRAIDGVTLDITAGRIVTIMGPSGSGKSTLLHLLGGLDHPTSGEIFLDGRALSGLSDRQLTVVRRRQVGFVFQTFNLVPVLTL